MGEEPKKFKENVEKTFDKFSDRYDDLVGGWMRYSTIRILDEIEIPDDPTCLDVASGTGLSTFELMEACGGRGTFYGIDIAAATVSCANGVARERGLGNVKFTKMDAEEIGFPDGTFDLVLSNMSLQFFPDKPKALREIHRVLKPGGQFAFTFQGGPGMQEPLGVMLEVASRHPEVPELLEVIRSSKSCFLGLEEWMDLLETAGLRLTNIYGRHSVSFPDPGFITTEDNVSWDVWRQAIPRDALDEIVEEINEAAWEAATERGFRSTSYVIFAWGTKPE
jgi:ubiquinone/menaquinone biosynthesis C-methylase UbiE